MGKGRPVGSEELIRKGDGKVKKSYALRDGEKLGRRTPVYPVS